MVLCIECWFVPQGKILGEYLDLYCQVSQLQVLACNYISKIERGGGGGGGREGIKVCYDSKN